MSRAYSDHVSLIDVPCLIYPIVLHCVAQQYLNRGNSSSALRFRVLNKRLWVTEGVLRYGQSCAAHCTEHLLRMFLRSASMQPASIQCCFGMIQDVGACGGITDENFAMKSPAWTDWRSVVESGLGLDRMRPNSA